jgi:hypothetical protein
MAAPKLAKPCVVSGGQSSRACQFISAWFTPVKECPGQNPAQRIDQA